MSWETDYLDELIAEHGEAIAVVWIGEEDFNPCQFEKLPEVLDEWIAMHAIPFSRSARAAAFRGLRRGPLGAWEDGGMKIRTKIKAGTRGGERPIAPSDSQGGGFE